MAKKKEENKIKHEIAPGQPETRWPESYVLSAKMLQKMADNCIGQLVLSSKLPDCNIEGTIEDAMGTLEKYAGNLEKDLCEAYARLDAMLYPVRLLRTTLEFYQSRRINPDKYRTLEDLKAAFSLVNAPLTEALKEYKQPGK